MKLSSVNKVNNNDFIDISTSFTRVKIFLFSPTAN